MANEEHLAKLREGPEAWNQWRKERADVVPDLLTSDLVRANLARANLAGADLGGAKLFEADLSGAHLARANLTGADLRKADLHEIVLWETIFGDTDLREVMGLDTCFHFGPSTLDQRTLGISGPLPLAFLRGCGLPDALITYLPSLLNQPIQFYSCFISYSTKDQEFADRLHADLQNKGVRCWFAPHQIQGGKKIHEQIDEAIRLYDRLLLIRSRDSMESEWVKTEIKGTKAGSTRETPGPVSGTPCRFRDIAGLGVLRCRYRQGLRTGDLGVLCAGLQPVEGP